MGEENEGPTSEPAAGRKNKTRWRGPARPCVCVCVCFPYSTQLHALHTQRITKARQTDLTHTP